MPFVSDRQRKFLYANKPEVARRFEEHESTEAPSRPRPKNRRPVWKKEKGRY